MKCVRNKQLKDKVRRVSEMEAEILVRSGEWHYCPKHVWRASRKKEGRQCASK